MAEEEKTLGEVACDAAEACRSRQGFISWGEVAAAVERAVVARLVRTVPPLTGQSATLAEQMATPPSVEIDALRAQVAALREERDEARRPIAEATGLLRRERDGALARVASLESSLAAERDCIPRPEPTADVLAVIRDLWTGHKHTPESAAAHVEAIVESRLAAERAAHERLSRAARATVEQFTDVSADDHGVDVLDAPCGCRGYGDDADPLAHDPDCSIGLLRAALSPAPAHVEGEKQGGGG